MRLKLEQRGEIKMLLVLDDISGQHSAILKAGLVKMFDSGTHSLILDLTGVTSISESTQSEIAELRKLAAESGAQLLISSPDLPIADVTGPNEALEKLNSPLAGLLAQEAKLEAKLRKLTRMKTVLEQKLAALDKSGTDVKALRRENSRLKQAVRRLDAAVTKIMNERPGDAAGMASQQKKAKDLDLALGSVLESQGVLALGRSGK